jgi:hypothetical protein
MRATFLTFLFVATVLGKYKNNKFDHIICLHFKLLMVNVVCQINFTIKYNTIQFAVLKETYLEKLYF